eukprot:279878-Chlamydomonas_euryale.AAC.8
MQGRPLTAPPSTACKAHQAAPETICTDRATCPTLPSSSVVLLPQPCKLCQVSSAPCFGIQASTTQGTCPWQTLQVSSLTAQHRLKLLPPRSPTRGAAAQLRSPRKAAPRDVEAESIMIFAWLLWRGVCVRACVERSGARHEPDCSGCLVCASARLFTGSAHSSDAERVSCASPVCARDQRLTDGKCRCRLCTKIFSSSTLNERLLSSIVGNVSSQLMTCKSKPARDERTVPNVDSSAKQ